MDSGRKTRVIVGALLGLLFVGIVALGSIFRTVVFTVAAVIAVYEMSNMIYKKTEKNIFAAPAYVFAALCFPVASFPAALAARMSAATAIMLLGALCLMLIAAERIFNRLRTTEESIYSAFMLIYPMSLFGMLALIMPADGLVSPKNVGLLLVFICPLMGDMLAYYIGSLMGKRKLCPEISPKKTIEGFVGGIVTTGVIFAAAFSIYNGEFKLLTAALDFAIGAVCGVIGTVGDLSASMVKRQIGFKDYGKIMPGHGGLMDRFDSVLFVLPTFYIMVCLIKGPIML